eukprot:3944948-Amphidinium_carterae.1
MKVLIFKAMRLTGCWGLEHWAQYLRSSQAFACSDEEDAISSNVGAFQLDGQAAKIDMTKNLPLPSQTFKDRQT